MLNYENREEIEELISLLRPLRLPYNNEDSTIQYVIDKVDSFIKRFEIPQPYRNKLEKYIRSIWIPEERAINLGFLVAENLEEYLKFLNKPESKKRILKNLPEIDSSKILTSVLHFSDLHYGEFSALNDEKRKGDFSNLFSNLEHKLNSIISNDQNILVVISGDISSRNRLFAEEKEEFQQEIPTFLIKFINIFASKEIPILLAKGNHEKDRDSNHSIDLFKKVFNKLRKDLNIKFSRDFEKNFTSYYLEPNKKFLFFTVDTTFSLSSKGNWTDSNIDLAKIDDFFEELIEEANFNLADYSIFLITHHPLESIPNNKSILAGLAERNIKIIFSGHIHEKAYKAFNIPDSPHVIHNYIAGSPSVSKEIRDEDKDWNLKSLQFNYYKVYRNLIHSYYYELDSNSLWSKKSLHQQKHESLGNKSQINNNIEDKKKEKFLKLAKLLDRLYYKRGKTAGAFTESIKNDPELRDLFGISFKNPQSTNLAGENVDFLDGDYYIIPNSVTLRKTDTNPEKQLITKNDADDDNIKRVIGGFLHSILISTGMKNLGINFKGRILDSDDIKP